MSQRMTLKVKMWGTTIGYIIQPEAGASLFRYDADFLNSGIEISPLMMPLSEATYSFPSLPENTFYGLPGLFADSLPDKFGAALLSGYLSSRGINAEELSAAERLCYTGHRGMGALEYEPAFEIDSQDSDINITELAKVAEALLARKSGERFEDKPGLVAQLMESSSSVGGARAKTLIAINPETGEVKSGKVDTEKGFEHWLLKFGSIRNNSDKDSQPDEDGYTRIEYAYYLMARDAGLDIMECRLRIEGDCAHFMTRRFDRNIETGERIHMQTLCGLSHMDFNSPRIYSYEQAFEVLRRMNLGYQAQLELYRRMVFNDFAKNYDDHTKNISFLMDKTGQWSLSPAYDVTFNYKPSSQWVNSHQMLIAGKAFDISQEDLLSVAKKIGIRTADARGIIEHIYDSVSKWEDFAQEAGVPERKFETIGGILLG